MSDLDDDVHAFIMLLDYFFRKMHDASTVPKHMSTFSGRDRMLELLYGHEERFVKVLRMKKRILL